MSTKITPKNAGQNDSLAELLDVAKAFASMAKSPKTCKEYNNDWNRFSDWTETNDIEPLPASPENIAAYIVHLDRQGRKPSGIERVLVSISQAHKLAGYNSPTSSAAVRETLKGIKRERGTAPTQKAPLCVSHLRRLLETLPDNLLGKRDRALLLTGFAGAFRRSELVALNVDDLEEVPEGFIITIRRSKTDQEGNGRKIGIPYGGNQETCPVRSIKAWLRAADINEGPIFRAVSRHGVVSNKSMIAQTVARVVKRAAAAAGLDETRFSGHSLRSGLATAAAQAGKSERQIMNQTGHKTEKMVRQYIRDGNLFRNNVTVGLI